MLRRCFPNTGYLYELDIYTARKEAAEFGFGESVVPQSTRKLNGNFCRISFGNFFISPLLLIKLTEGLLNGIGVVQQNRKGKEES